MQQNKVVVQLQSIYFLVVLQIKQTWIYEHNGIENTELNDINVDVVQPFYELQQTGHQLSIPAYVNALLWWQQQICSKANGSSAIN